MSKTLLIYERAVPVSKKHHAQHYVQPSPDYGFARDVNSLPLLAQEFRVAAAEYPIVFAGNKEQVMPAVLLGFAEQENFFIDDEGRWKSRYIPAFARRYPYIFSSADQGKTFTLCIDEEYQGLNTSGQGERLFNDDGEQTDYLNKILDFQKNFQLAHHRTQEFCKRIMKLGLLEPTQAQLKYSSGENRSMGGFMAISRERLRELSGEALAELNQLDELELIYLHLQSMRNIADLADLSDPGAATDDASAEKSSESKKTTAKKLNGASRKKTAKKK